jgi:hypothetical protein
MFEHELYRWTYITRERPEENQIGKVTCCSSTSPFTSFAVTAVDGEDPFRRIDVVPRNQGEHSVGVSKRCPRAQDES